MSHLTMRILCGVFVSLAICGAASGFFSPGNALVVDIHGVWEIDLATASVVDMVPVDSLGLITPHGMSLGRKGTVLVANWGDENVVRFNLLGGAVDSIEDGHIGLANYVAEVGDGSVFVNSWGWAVPPPKDGHDLVKFSSGGAFQWRIDQFLLGGLAADPAGLLYLADSANIEKWTLDGVFSATVASGSYNDLSVSSTGLLLAADWPNQEIDVFGPSGGLLRTVNAVVQPGRVAANSAGFAVATSSANNRVDIYDPNGIWQGSVTGASFEFPLGVVVIPQTWLLGDANEDGVVDDADLSLLLANWGQNVGWELGDFDGDNVVTDADLSLLLANWTGSILVPEPASALILLLGFAGAPLRRGR